MSSPHSEPTVQRADRIRFLVRPGWVTSRTDGQRHWITADKLMRLYLLRREECIVEGEPSKLHTTGPRFDTRHLIQITPRYDGNYPAFQKPMAKKITALTSKRLQRPAFAVDSGDFPELTAHENRIIAHARAHGFAGFFPCFPSAEAQARNTLAAARSYLGQDHSVDPEK